MARRSIPSLDAEFANVMSFLKNRVFIANDQSEAITESAKRIHRATHSLILWRFRLKGLPIHGRVFVDEIASDALQILPQSLMGYGKTAKLLTRGIIENTLRHLYFSDHPVEFARMNASAKWYISVSDLFEYAKHHPSFLDLETRFDAIGRLSNLYDDLSAGVHGRTVVDLEMRVALNKIKCDVDQLKSQTNMVERAAEGANFLIAVFHGKQLHAFLPDERRIILRTLPPTARQLWKALE